MAAISTVSSSRSRHSTVPSMPNSLRSPARNARPTSPCSSSVIPSAMSTVSFDSAAPLWSPLAAGPAGAVVRISRLGRAVRGSRSPRPTRSPRRLAARLRRRRAERLVPVPCRVRGRRAPFARSDPPLDRPPRPCRRPRAAATAARAVPDERWPPWRAPWPDRLPRARSARAAAGRPPGAPGPDPGLDPHAAEEARLRLAHHDHLGIGHRHAQLVQGALGRLLDRLSRHLNPFHALPSLSGRLDRDRGCAFGAALALVSRLAVRRAFAVARPSACARCPGRCRSSPSGRRHGALGHRRAVGGGRLLLRWWRRGLRLGGFSRFRLLASFLAEPISRSAATGFTMPGPEHHFLRPDAHGGRDHHVNGCSRGHS